MPKAPEDSIKGDCFLGFVLFFVFGIILIYCMIFFRDNELAVWSGVMFVLSAVYLYLWFTEKE